MHRGLPFLTALVRMQSPLCQEAQTSLLDYKRARPCHPKSFGCLDQKPAKCQMFQPSPDSSARHRHIRGPNRDQPSLLRPEKVQNNPKSSGLNKVIVVLGHQVLEVVCYTVKASKYSIFRKFPNTQTILVALAISFKEGIGFKFKNSVI